MKNKMKPIDKANELKEKFKMHVNPYFGSGMLTNTYDDRAIDFQSNFCAIIAVNEIIKSVEWEDDFNDDHKKYWSSVKDILVSNIQ